MSKLWGLMSWGCGSLAAALVVVSLLAVPTQNAWADEPITSEDELSTQPLDSDTCTASQTVNSVSGLMTCSFSGECRKNGVNVGCSNTTVTNSSGIVTGCSTKC